MPDFLLFAIVLGFLSGVVVGADFWFGCAVACMAIVGVVYFGRRFEISFTRSMYVVIPCIMVFACIGGYARYVASLVERPVHLESQLENKIELTGEIQGDPVIAPGKVTAIMYLDGIGFRLSIKTSTPLAHGDTITVSGVLRLPENFMTEHGTEFDYVSYLQKDRILYLVTGASLIVHERDEQFSLTRSLYSIRHSIEELFFEFLPEREGGLLAGILLGTKTAIDESLYSALVRTSTVHIVALSGYNVSIVANTISKILGTFLPQLFASLFGILGIVSFVVMTGASSTAVRAGMMAVIMIIARVMGRPADAMRIIALASLALVLYNPAYLVSDVSFQLSFMATLGLLLVSPTYVTWLSRWMHPVLAEMIGTTFAAETAVSLFIMNKMGVFSIISLPVNVAILPFIPLLMFGGAVLLCVGFTIPVIASIIAYPSYLIAKGIIGVIMLGSMWQFASINTPGVSSWFVLVCYGLIIWFFVGRTLTKSVK